MALDGAARTHAGRVRTANEDAWLCRPTAGIFAVVDGLGGEEAGDVAAAIAVAALAEIPDLRELPGETVLAQALRVARDRILDEADRDPQKEGMGAVATAVRFDDAGQMVSLAHVGDTRAYLVHAGGVRQLSRDHVAEATGGQKARVARDLGRRDLQGEWVETSRSRVSPGDVLVLCSDGLHDVVQPAELAAELVTLRAEAKTADAIATRLVAMALAAGGPDNVTVVAVRVGRFRRGGGDKRMVKPAQIGVLLALVVGVAAGAWLLGERPDALPTTVVGVVELGPPASLTLTAASKTHVASEGALRVAGQRLDGGDWTVSVAAGASFHLERTVLAVERDLVVDLSSGGELLVRDVRIESGRLRVIAPAGARVILEHLTLGGPDSLVIEGAGLVSRSHVGHAGPAEPAPPPGAP
ncbi:MAG: protein serine/threonine phosphatase 2C family protein [Myxococcales bacterium]|nr:protein serine/threonine phosphatase 2C family protein [Myxococcales bacterium]